MSNMNTRDQAGFISATLISLIIVSVLLAGAIGFGVWAFMQRQDYKNNSDQKSAAAAQEAREATQAEDVAKYAEEAKNPLKTYTGPSAYGSVTLQYPKTWSGYVVSSGRSSEPLDGYFHPDIVPDILNDTNSFALRVEIVTTSYDNILSEFDDVVERNEARVSPFSLEKVTGVTGARIDGQIDTNKQGSMVVFPLRNVTLKVWTESDQFLADFNNIILPNLSFSP